jgi:ammonium transporter, Amt family
MAIEWYKHGRPSVLGIISGAVAGLVAITPACAYVSPMGAIAIGALAGLLCFYAATSLKRKFGYDDSLDVFGVHGIGGLVGVIGIGVFGSQSWGGTAGLLEGNTNQLWVQIEGALIVAAWCGLITVAILWAIKKAIGLRVTLEDEVNGLDLSLHGEVVP